MPVALVTTRGASIMPIASSPGAHRAIHAAVSATPRVHPAATMRPSGSAATTPVSLGATPGRPWPHARSTPRIRNSVEGVGRHDVAVVVEGPQGVVLTGRREPEDAPAEAQFGVVVDHLAVGRAPEHPELQGVYVAAGV